MRIITFLNKQRKERILKKIHKLEKHSNDYLEKARYFKECLDLFDNYPNLCQLSLPYSFFRTVNSSIDLSLNFFNDYLHWSFMHDRAESKIKSLKRKLENL